MRSRRESGFSLLEVLVVVGIIGIISVLAVANYWTALDRARQKQTMADMRTIAMAWESRATDSQSYLVAGFSFPTTAVEYTALSGALTPTYIRNLPELDGWKRAYEFAVDGTSGYAIRSPGRDGTFEDSYVRGATTDPDADIVWANGSFIQFPDGVQQN